MANSGKKKAEKPVEQVPQENKKKSKPVSNNALWIGRMSSGRGAAAILVIALAAALLCGLLENTGILSAGREAANGSESIRINEIVTDNTSTILTNNGNAEDWIEITNTGRTGVNLDKFLLFQTSDPSSIFSFPSYVLQPNEYVVVFADGTLVTKGTEWHAPFKMSASGGDVLQLLNAQSIVVDSVQLPEIKQNQAYARNENGDWKITTTATPGSGNVIRTEETVDTANEVIQAMPDVLEITEVMSGNTIYPIGDDGKCMGYIEIHNRSAGSVDLEDWYLSDTSSKLKKWRMPAYTIRPDEYVLVSCGNTSTADGFHAPFKVSSSGETVYLTNDEGIRASVVNVPAMEKNKAYSYADGAWTAEYPPTPGMANTLDSAAEVQEKYFGGRSEVCINEIMASPSQQSYDWIEIYNGSSSSIDLSDYGLSDNAAKPRKWQFPSGTVIQSGSFMVVCTSGMKDAEVAGFVNADYTLSANGGYTVSLSDPNGRILDAAFVPQQYNGIAYGRMNGGKGWYYLETPTPGAANSGSSFRGRAGVPQYSIAGGLYKSGEAFSVELTAPEGSRIYYTLDSTDPDDGDMLYTQPIEVSSTTILRTRVYRDGYMPSYMDSRSYLFDIPEGVRVVSLVSDPDGLFSDERGILVKGPNALPNFPYGSDGKGANFWMDWEREAHVELFQPDGETQLSQECGIKLHGQYSRAAAAKAFKVYARSEYGNNRFNAKIFTKRDYTSYQSFLIRCAGQDYNKAFMRDSILTGLARDTSVMYQESDFAICYLNGSFYSIVYLRERISKFSICQFEGWEGMEDSIDIIKANSRVMQGSNDSFAQLLEYVKKADPTTEDFYARLGEAIDIKNYIEYMAIEIFSGNGDTLNVKRYRNPLTDGKWRWVLFDLDWAFYVDTNSIRRWVTPGGMGTNLRTDNTLFIACMKNPRFRDEFLTHFGTELATTFSSERVVKQIEDRYNLIKDYLPPYLEKLGMTEAQYKKELRTLVNYAKTRPSKILGYFNETFNFSNAEQQKYFGAAIEAINAYEAKG